MDCVEIHVLVLLLVDTSPTLNHDNKLQMCFNYFIISSDCYPCRQTIIKLVHTRIGMRSKIVEIRQDLIHTKKSVSLGIEFSSIFGVPLNFFP